MILVKNRELLFSNREQYIGTPYDNNSEIRIFSIDRMIPGGVDISALSFRLDLKYAKNNQLDTCLLDKQITDEKILLTWTIVNSILQVKGPVFINIRATDGSGTVKWSSFQAVVYVEDSINTPGNYTGKLTELEQLEKRIEEKTETLDANEDERQSNEQKRQKDTAAAIERADTAASKAVESAKGVTAAIERVNEAAEGVEDAISRADTAASNTEQAIRNANTAATAANTAASDVNTAKSAANLAATAANAAATKADIASGAADESKVAADTAAIAANIAAQNAQSYADYAESQGDYAKKQGDYAKEKGGAANTAAAAAILAASDVDTAKNTANAAATAANTAASAADVSRAAADAAASTAGVAAGNAQTQANYAKDKGDYAKGQGDYAKEQGDAAKLAAAGAIPENGGDISNTYIKTLDSISEEFPEPKAGERARTFAGKVKKFISDFKAMKSSLVLISQIINTFEQTEPGTVADGRALKTLKDSVDENAVELANLIESVLLSSAISNTQVNASNKVPSSALVYLMQQAITKNAADITSLNGELKFSHFITSSNLGDENAKNAITSMNLSRYTLNVIFVHEFRIDSAAELLLGYSMGNYSFYILLSYYRSARTYKYINGTWGIQTLTLS